MKAGKENKSSALTELKGKVVRRKFGKGSKSEHDAVYLESDKGSYQLRRAGGNPFSDPGLDKWVGKKVIAKGTIDQYLFIANSLEEI